MVVVTRMSRDLVQRSCAETSGRLSPKCGRALEDERTAARGRRRDCSTPRLLTNRHVDDPDARNLKAFVTSMLGKSASSNYSDPFLYSRTLSRLHAHAHAR